MLCITEDCEVCLRWGSEEAHCCCLSSSRTMSILNEVALKGLVSLTLKSFVLKEAIDQPKYLHLTKENFPNLEHVDLFMVNVNELAVNENIKSVVLRSCHYERREPYQPYDFPFPFAESIALISMISKFTSKCRLPCLRNLQNLEIRNCFVEDKLSKNKFPALRSLVLEVVSVCKNIKITRMNRLHRVKLIDIEDLPPKTNWKGVCLLSLSKLCAFRLWKIVDIDAFPRLQVLYINCSEDVVIKLFNPHPNLKKLSIRTKGQIIGVGDLESRYPMLIDLSLDGKLNVKEVPILHGLQRVQITPCPLKKNRKNWMKKCPKLKLFNSVVFQLFLYVGIFLKDYHS